LNGRRGSAIARFSVSFGSIVPTIVISSDLGELATKAR
jgi:hypothetical protein